MVRPRQARPPRSQVVSLSGVAPITFRTLAEQVASSIRQAIAQGRIRPATRLLEGSIAREMKTSRAPVREALGQLEREGFVIKQPNRGARVVEMTEDMVREVASLRGVLEGFAASLAVDRLGPQDYETLRDMVEGMERAARHGEFSQLIELDYQFHAFICRAAGHRILYETWTGMDGKIRLFLSATNLMYRDLKSIVQGHREILGALRRRDKAAASRVMGEHLGEVLDLFLSKVIRKDGEARAMRSEMARQAKRARQLAVERLGAGGGRAKGR